MMSKRIVLLIIVLLAASFGIAISGCGANGKNGGAGETGVLSASERFAADFTVYTATGEEVRLSALRGQPVIVNFFATWCPPCKAELPDFDSAAARYGDRICFLMVDLLGGYSESVAGTQQFTEENGYSFPLYFDITGEAADAYSVTSIPTTLAVDAEGRLVYSHTGMLSAAEIETLINSLLP